MTKAKVLLVLFLLGFVFSAFACGRAVSPIENTTWVLSLWSVIEHDQYRNVLPNTEITALFDSTEGQVTGSAGCNSYSASYDIKNNEISIISPISATEMYCDEPGVMEQEELYLGLLGTITTFKIDKDELMFFSHGRPILVFVNAASTSTSATRDWLNIELTDIATGEVFTIGDFKGKPVLLETFAVWCPTCLAQQREMQKLIESEGEAIIHISINTDPNEDENKVKEHIERNSLDWYFAVAPVELTRALIDEFGLNVVAPPRAPVVLICEDQSVKFLRSGVKSAEELISEVEEGCQ